MNALGHRVVLGPDSIPKEVLERGRDEYLGERDPDALEWRYFEIPVNLTIDGTCLTEYADGSPIELPAVFWVCAVARATAQCAVEGRSEIDMDFAGGDRLSFELRGEDVDLSRFGHDARASVSLTLLRDEAVRVLENVRLQLRQSLPELEADLSLTQGSNNWLHVGPDFWFRHGRIVFGWRKNASQRDAGGG